MYYTKSLLTALPFHKTTSIELEPQLLEEMTGLDTTSGTVVITGTFDKERLAFDLPFESEEQTLPLDNADIALNIPKSGIPEDILKNTIHRLSNGRHYQLNLPELSQFQLWLDDNGGSSLTMYTFREPLSENNAAQLLGSYGIFSKKTILLPDGTLSYEHIAPKSTSSTSLFGTHINQQKEIITLKKRKLTIQKTNQTPLISEIKSSCGENTWIRLSQISLKTILMKTGVEKPPENLPNIQIGSQKNTVFICFE